jgi:hypothetical protein
MICEWGTGKGSAREDNYEEEWDEGEEEGEDIGGIWQVVKGRQKQPGRNTDVTALTRPRRGTTTDGKHWRTRKRKTSCT